MEQAKFNNDNVLLEGWTKEEKIKLLESIKAFGSKDIEQIHDNISTKSTEEITDAIEFYKNKIKLLDPPASKRKGQNKKKQTFIPRIPLASWAKYLTDSLTFEELQTETSTALRLIADLEDIPPPLFTENIDFRKIYHQIANAMDGIELVEDKGIDAVLSKCIVETALTSKAFIRNSTLKQIVADIDISATEMNVYPKSVYDNEIITLRHLTSQTNYNPLNLSEEWLLPFVHKK